METGRVEAGRVGPPNNRGSGKSWGNYCLGAQSWAGGTVQLTKVLSGELGVGKLLQAHNTMEVLEQRPGPVPLGLLPQPGSECVPRQLRAADS